MDHNISLVLVSVMNFSAGEGGRLDATLDSKILHHYQGVSPIGDNNSSSRGVVGDNI